MLIDAKDSNADTVSTTAPSDGASSSGDSTEDPFSFVNALFSVLRNLRSWSGGDHRRRCADINWMSGIFAAHGNDSSCSDGRRRIAEVNKRAESKAIGG